MIFEEYFFTCIDVVFDCKNESTTDRETINIILEQTAFNSVHYLYFVHIFSEYLRMRVQVKYRE